MSAAVPYVAPWKADWTQYSTQLYTPHLVGTTTVQMVVPAGQWWRPVFLTCQLVTDAVAANRQVNFDVLAQGGATIMTLVAPSAQAASLTGSYIASPGVDSIFKIQNAPLLSLFSSHIPDLIWPQGVTFQFVCLALDAGDALSAPALWAVEVYTEAPRGAVEPLALTPVLV